MAITQDHGRQHALTAVQAFTYADLESGTDLPAVNVPGGAIILSGELIIETALNSATSDTISVGDGSTADAYLAATDVQSTGRTALTSVGAGALAAKGAVNLTWTGSGAAPSAGSGYLVVTYAIVGRSTDVQP